jgi:hypothetical protein
MLLYPAIAQCVFQKAQITSACSSNAAAAAAMQQQQQCSSSSSNETNVDSR